MFILNMKGEKQKHDLSFFANFFKSRVFDRWVLIFADRVGISLETYLMR